MFVEGDGAMSGGHRAGVAGFAIAASATLASGASRGVGKKGGGQSGDGQVKTRVIEEGDERDGKGKTGGTFSLTVTGVDFWEAHTYAGMVAHRGGAKQKSVSFSEITVNDESSTNCVLPPTAHTMAHVNGRPVRSI